MLKRLFRHCALLGQSLVRALWQRLLTATKPAGQGVVVGPVADLVRSRPELVAEKALLRQRLLVLRRSVKRPRCTPTDRAVLVQLVSRNKAWHRVLLILQPETLLRRHRRGSRLFWRRKSRPRSSPQPKVASATIALIRELAVANRLWGAERIRGELLKLGIPIAKATVQRHMRGTRPTCRADQSWATFPHNHGAQTWACDFLPSPTCSSGPCTPSSWSRPGPVAWCMSVPRVTRRTPESPSSCARPRRSTSGRATSSAIATASTGRPPPASGRRAASRICEPRTAPPGRTPPASGSSAACGGSAWITLCCWARPTCSACSASTWPISTRTGRIRVSDSMSPAPPRPPQYMRAGWASCRLSQISVASTTRIGGPRCPEYDRAGQVPLRVRHHPTGNLHRRGARGSCRVAPPRHRTARCRAKVAAVAPARRPKTIPLARPLPPG